MPKIHGWHASCVDDQADGRAISLLALRKWPAFVGSDERAGRPAWWRHPGAGYDQQNEPRTGLESQIVLNELFMSMAVRKGAADLLQFINVQIFLAKQGGELDQLTRQYLGVPAGNLPVF